jgi:DNA invertase Pin-like site-specific DNA recombinase
VTLINAARISKAIAGEELARCARKRWPARGQFGQYQELWATGARAGWNIAQVSEDKGISGSKGRDQRPAFDRLHRAIGRRSRYRRGVERRPLGRSLQDLAAFLGELRAAPDVV